MFILSIILLPTDRTQAVQAENGTTKKQTPVTENVTDVVFAPIIPTVLTDSNIEVKYF